MNQLSVDLIRAHVKHGQLGPIAQNLGIHRNTLSLKLRGEVALRLEEINAIAGYLGVGVDKFLRLEHPTITQEPSVGESQPTSSGLQPLTGAHKQQAMERMQKRLEENPEEHQATWEAVKKGLKEAPFSLREVHLEEPSEK